MSTPLIGDTGRRVRGLASKKFTRRPPSLAEQQARKRWGKTWGPILADIGRKVREERR